MSIFQRRVLPALFIFILLVLSAACTSDDAKPGPTSVHDSGLDAKTGAYQPIPPDSPAALRAYRVTRDALAVQKPAFILGPILTVESQVVAGSKIRLYCRYRESEDTPEKVCRAVVFVDLNDNASLIELDWGVKTP